MFTWATRSTAGSQVTARMLLPVKAVLGVAYVAMGVWLLVAAALRIAIQLASGLPLDPLPFISGGLGLLALIALVPGYEEWRERRRNRDQRHIAD